MSVVSLALMLVACPAAGRGIIGGTAPDGLVTIDNVPGRAVVDLLRRSDHAWSRRTVSDDLGQYRFPGLSLATEYDVIGRDPADVWGDVIVSRVFPYAMPEITTEALAFTAGMQATTLMAVAYGAGPFVWSASGGAGGASMDAAGQWSGIPAAGSYPVTVEVVDVHGAVDSRDYVVVVA